MNGTFWRGLFDLRNEVDRVARAASRALAEAHVEGESTSRSALVLSSLHVEVRQALEGFAGALEVSPDDRYMYVAAFGSREVVRFDREADPVEARTVAIDILADNLRWSDDGKLYTVGGNYVSPDECAEPPCQTGWSVVAIDPETLEWTRVAGADQNASLQGASTALPVGDEIWIGTFSGDRIGYLPRP